MKTQPNFEKIKVAFYNGYVNSAKANIAISMENLTGRLLPSFHIRKETFKQDFNNWLNSIDIRQAHILIDILNESKIKLPFWIKSKQFTIDYNKHLYLDLIK